MEGRVLSVEGMQYFIGEITAIARAGTLRMARPPAERGLPSAGAVKICDAIASARGGGS